MDKVNQWKRKRKGKFMKAGNIFFTLTALIIVGNVSAVSLGDRVQANGVVNVRQTAGGTAIGKQTNTLGIVIGGPTTASLSGTSYTWYDVNFDTGFDGWVADSGTAIGLIIVIPATPAGPSPGSVSSPGPAESSSTVTLSWGASIGATYYDLGVKDVATGLFVVNTTTASTSYTASLTAGKTYKWNVAAGDSAGESSFTTVLYFTTPAALLSAPSLSGPANGATGVSTTPAFSWTSVSGANRYWLTLATSSSALPTDPNATTCPTCVTTGISGNTDQTNYTPPAVFPYNGTTTTLNPNTTYYWEVQGWSTSGTEGNYSSVRSFTTSASCNYSLSSSGAGPGAGSGASSFTVTTGDSCAWSAISDATSWLHTSSSGNGSGTVNYGYDANAGASSRTGHIAVGGQTFTVTQSGTSAAPVVLGVDVYEGSAPVDWSLVYNTGGKRFAFLKASSGIHGADTEFLKYVSDIKSDAPNLIFGAYHFAYPMYAAGNTGAAEGQHFLTIAGNYVGAGYLPPVLDVEDDTVALNWIIRNHLTPTQLVQWVIAWAQVVETKNVTPIIYTTKCYLDYMNQDPNTQDLQALHNLPIWIASYYNADPTSVPPWVGACSGSITDWAFQQYATDPATQDTIASEGGTCPGINGTGGYADLDSFNGTLTALNTLVSNGIIPPSDTTSPAISTFTVSPSSISVGSSFMINYTVSDTGGSGLNRIVLRRTSGDGSANDPGWQDVQTATSSGNGPTSSHFTDSPPSVGTYWYGMAAFDNANNYMDERIAGLGPTQITITQVQTDVQAPALTISSPLNNASVASSSLLVSGTASDSGLGNNGISTVTVSGITANGSIATGAGTANWSATITLNPGANAITVIATDSVGNSVQTQISVTYNSGGGGGGGGGGDSISPTIGITSPTSGSTYSTYLSSIDISGTADDNVGVTQVAWSNNLGGSGTASGTTSWTANGINLLSGQNVIFITAHDAAGNAGLATLTVTCMPSPTFGGSVVVDGKLQTTLSGLLSGATIVFQVSSDLKNWIPIQTNFVGGTTLLLTNTINPAMNAQYVRAVVQ